jgi:O-antigen/teichoic acid export membrane protein
VRPSLFSRLLYGDPSQTLAILVVAASIPGYLLIRNLATTFMGLKLFRAGSFPEFVQAIVYAAVGIPLALVLRTALAGLLGFTLATYVSVGLFLFLLIRYLRNLEPTYRVAAEPGFHRHLLSFSLWFVVTPVLGQFFHYVDRLSLQHLRGAFDQGVYSAVVNIAETISAFGLAISSVVYPHISAIWESGDRERALVNLDLAFRVTGVLMLVLGLLLVLFGRLFILLLLGDKYLPGAQALPFLVVYYLFTVFVWLLGVYPTLIERTYVGAIALVIALPTSILLNRVLIPHLGMVGAALATMLSYLLMWMIVVILCRRFGMKTGRRTLSVCLLAFLLLLPSLLGSLVARVPCGPSAARLLAVVPDLVGVTAIGLVVYACIRRTWILSAAEREIAFTEVRRTVARFWGAVSRRR